ncbi:MAG: HNH endonuclease [Trichocoleus desertorum ATA4-8-CV12]|nr:HNH endonuclease [Trichocoleus desertorum ATA4-8-CV12]
MSRNKIPEAVQEQVRQRASGLCEYCHASEQWQYVRFTVDHVIPLAKSGADSLDNLALACFHCNRRKAAKTTAIDPDSNLEVLLFNPRQDVWSHHFIWSASGLLILSLTPTGRATVAALDLNRDRVINIRAADQEIGRHPPPNDPRQVNN